MISLHVVSGPWTSIVAALDKGRFNIAVCRRYNIPASRMDVSTLRVAKTQQKAK
jgi:hypothetical protein